MHGMTPRPESQMELRVNGVPHTADLKILKEPLVIADISNIHVCYLVMYSCEYLFNLNTAFLHSRSYSKTFLQTDVCISTLFGRANYTQLSHRIQKKRCGS